MAAIPAFEQAFKLDDALSSLEMWAQSCLLAGQYPQAATLYLQACQRAPEQYSLARGLLQAIRQLNWSECPAEVAERLLWLLQYPELDVNAISSQLAQAILHSPFVPGSTLWLSQPLLVQALSRVLFTSTELEAQLTDARCSVLLQALQQGQLSDQILPFWQGMMHQCWLNEYLYCMAPRERELVAAMQHELEQAATQGSEPIPYLGVLCLLAAYQDLSQGLIGQWLAQWQHYAWPEPLDSWFEQCLIPAWRQQRLAVNTPSLQQVSEPTSARVQAQYEAQPYPRWFQLGAGAPLWFGQRLQQVLPEYVPPDWSFKPDMSVLIAGCGTGRHALRAAVEYRQSRVLAIDLSRSSLGYAQDKALHLALQQVEFLQADILDLPQLSRHFPLIESVGVLHHMAQPDVGWRVLKRCLQPKGLMQIGLYSRLARQSIQQCRDWITQLGLSNSATDIRRLRQLLMDKRLAGFSDLICHSRDFFSLSGCRDLLFHECEHQFELPQIAELLAELELEFLGFSSLPAAVVQQYQIQYPQDPLRRNLHYWAQFEQQYPWIFSRMYVFWCQSLN